MLLPFGRRRVVSRGGYYHGMNYYRRKLNPAQRAPVRSRPNTSSGRRRGVVVLLFPELRAQCDRAPPRAAQAIRPPRHSLALGRLHDRVRSLTGPGANEPFCCPQGFWPCPRRRGRIFAFSRLGGVKKVCVGSLSESARRHAFQKPKVCVCMCLCAPRRTQRLSARLLLVS